MPRPGAVDRLPNVCAAGCRPRIKESAAESFKEYNKDELAQTLVQHKMNQALRKPPERLAIILPEINQIKNILAPDLNKSRFLEFKDQFYEKIYCKKVPLGKATPTNSKPDDVTNWNKTFGKQSVTSEKLYELVLPNRPYKDVLEEYVKWHDKYILSHNNYFPSEQVCRGYKKPFDKDKTYGDMVNKVDTTGNRVKMILQDRDLNKIAIVNKLQDDNMSRRTAALGKPFRRYNFELPFNPCLNIRSDETVGKLLKSTDDPHVTTRYANETTYRLFTNDLLYAPSDCRNPAGKFESVYPKEGHIKFFAENLGEETTVKQLVSPTIPLLFGLSHRDFFLPRSKEEIRNIFGRVGYDVHDEKTFEKAWELALQQWTCIGDRASIEAFKYAWHKTRATSSE